MRKSRKFIAALAAALFVSAIPGTAFGDVIVRNTSKSDNVSVKELIDSGKMTLEEIESLGPGYAAKIAEELGTELTEVLEEENTEFDGPTVKKVNLGESYHELYQTYEESLADQFFLYSNVGNGGLTHEPVMIDIPANVTYVMEKDGVPIEYISRQYVSELGTYVLKLTAIENPELPLSQQTEYQAVFRFRIQDEPPVTETEAEGTAGTSGTTGSASIWGSTSGGINVSGDIPVIAPPETEAVKESEPETEAADATEESTEAAVETEPSGSVRVPRSHNYEPATGNYVTTLENGKQLASSVPEGYVGSASVFLSVSEGDAVMTKLYRNDEPVEFMNGGVLNESGRYRVELDGCAYFFTIASDVSNMDYYPAPAGMEFTEVRLNDELVTLESSQYVAMEDDGTYVFYLSGDDGNRLEVILVKDTTAPEVNVTINGSEAAIGYVSGDIETIVLTRNGNLVEGFSGSLIKDPGKYTLTVIDAAGNETTESFSLNYQVNMYGIFALVLVVLVIAGIVVFVIHTKKNVKVR